MKILVVDDEPGMRSLIETIFLCYAAHDVSTASDGIDGLAKARKINPDLIVSDTMMPGMSGPDFLDAYTAENLGVKTILMSAEEKSYVYNKYPSAAKYAFLKKPFNIDEFKQLYHEVTKTS